MGVLRRHSVGKDREVTFIRLKHSSVSSSTCIHDEEDMNSRQTVTTTCDLDKVARESRNHTQAPIKGGGGDPTPEISTRCRRAIHDVRRQKATPCGDAWRYNPRGRQYNDGKLGAEPAIDKPRPREGPACDEHPSTPPHRWSCAARAMSTHLAHHAELASGAPRRTCIWRAGTIDEGSAEEARAKGGQRGRSLYPKDGGAM